jgi:hypothetical protein
MAIYPCCDYPDVDGSALWQAASYTRDRVDNMIIPDCYTGAKVCTKCNHGDVEQMFQVFVFSSDEKNASSSKIRDDAETGKRVIC